MAPFLRPAVAFAALLAVQAGLSAQTPDVSQLVSASVVGPAPSASSPRMYTVGVRLKIRTAWHVYWLNPGDSGQQTALKLDLPPGFKQVSEWRYPLPVKFMQAGDLVGYGYKDEVTFLTDIAAPEDWTPASPPVTVKAQVIHLVCDNICIPGQAALTATLSPAGTDAQPIATADALMPRPEVLPAKVSGVLKPAPDGTPAGGPLSPFTAEVTLPEDQSGKLELFPLPPEAVDLQNVTVEQTPGKPVIIKFDAKIYSGTTVLPRTIRLLAVTRSGPDKASTKAVGRWIEVPILASPK